LTFIIWQIVKLIRYWWKQTCLSWKSCIKFNTRFHYNVSNDCLSKTGKVQKLRHYHFTWLNQIMTKMTALTIMYIHFFLMINTCGKKRQIPYIFNKTNKIDDNSIKIDIDKIVCLSRKMIFMKNCYSKRIFHFEWYFYGYIQMYMYFILYPK
jgi:hypothetical protein